jgi:hypothetical protein
MFVLERTAYAIGGQKDVVLPSLNADGRVAFHEKVYWSCRRA